MGTELVDEFSARLRNHTAAIATLRQEHPPVDLCGTPNDRS